MTWGFIRMAYVKRRQLSRSKENFIVARTHAAAVFPINKSIMQKYYNVVMITKYYIAKK
jgi:hypothetical protein